MLPVIKSMRPSQEKGHRLFVRDNPELFLYEHKLDGWRCVAHVENGKVVLRSKRGGMLRGFSVVERAVKGIGFSNAIFDGELVCFDAAGNPCFEDVQVRKDNAVYMVFDVLQLEEVNLVNLPLEERKLWLTRIFQGSTGHVRGHEFFLVDAAAELMNNIKKNRWEGVVAKRLDSPYDANQIDAWVKIYNPAYIPKLIDRKKRFDRKR